MIIDSNGKECQEVNFHIGASTTTTRQWDIYVTQYNCGQEDTAGPPGCLQYMTGTSGTVSSFNFNPSNTATATDASTTHLQNQHYEICIRRESGTYFIMSFQCTLSNFCLSLFFKDTAIFVISHSIRSLEQVPHLLDLVWLLLMMLLPNQLLAQGALLITLW